MDIVDRADEQAQFHLDHEIAKVRNQAKTTNYRNRTIGRCLFCEEKVDDNAQVFCDEFCKEDYERLERARQHRGV